MPGYASARRRRPARAVLGKTPPCDGWYAWGLHGGAMVDSWVPRVRVGSRGLCSGVNANANPDTSNACNGMEW
ncbi:MAG UNVERIFIED_CONTAM: hypothetical protein LVR18_12890 [Planctomycetaceae bacterium]